MNEFNPAAESKRNRWFAVGALAVAGVAFLIITFGGIGQNLVYYWSPTDLHAAGNKAIGANIRLGGLVKEGSISHLSGVSNLEFDVSDGKSIVHVKSTGVPPQMFREGIGVVVEGTMTRAGSFQCDRLMVKHGNDYRAPKPGEKVDVEKMIKSMKE
jgi:cytochrome c-type biogenesis protein CcmE